MYSLQNLSSIQSQLSGKYPSLEDIRREYDTLVNDRHQPKGKAEDPNSKKKCIASQGFVLHLATDLDPHPRHKQIEGYQRNKSRPMAWYTYPTS